METATIAIAKAAADLCPDLLISVGAPSKRENALEGKKPDIFLTWPSGLTCKLYKGYPREDDTVSQLSTDLLRPTFKRWGLVSSGLEPDIVLTFRHHQRPGHQLTHLGDAKRTMKEDGGYVRASIHNAVRYVIAYQRELKAQMHRDERLFSGPLQPLYTLFVFAPKDTRAPALEAYGDDWLHIHYLGVDFGPEEMCSQGLRTWMQRLTTRAECYFDALSHVQSSQRGV